MVATSSTVMGAAVELVRQAKGWTQGDLAEAAGVSQSFVSKVESGALDLREDQVDQLADALGCPTELLRDAEVPLNPAVSCIQHRRRKTRLNALATRRVQATAQLTSLSVTRLANHQSAIEFQSSWAPKAGSSPDSAASEVRHLVGQSTGPLEEPALLIEELLNAVVLRRHLANQVPNAEATNAQDAVSVQGAGRVPTVILNVDLPGDRERFTLAHELGHLLLHSWTAAVGDEDIEAEANRFASELLMPSTEARDLLKGLAPNRFKSLLDLKSHWGISVAALIERARQVDAIDSGTHKRMRIMLNELGWTRYEPHPIVSPKTQRLHSIIQNLRGQGMTLDQMACVALVRPHIFTNVYESSLVNQGTTEGASHDSL